MLPKCMLKSNQKLLSTLNQLLKFVVSFIALFYIGYRITSTNFNIADLYYFLTPSILFFVVILSLGNWFFEILKWKIAMETFTKISLKKATYETLVAYTYGLVTPFNSGNYFKKISFYAKEHSKKIVFLNLSKGMYQMITTLIFGIWGISILLEKIDTRAFNQQTFLLITSGIGLIVGLIFRKKIIQYIKNISITTHLLLFVFSVIKFLFFFTFIDGLITSTYLKIS